MTLVANPTLDIVAALVDVPQVTAAVRFCVLPSVKVPVAVNCCDNPSAMDDVGGATAMETSMGAMTVSGVEPWMEPTVASIVVPPGVELVANPALLMVAIPVADEVQTAALVRFCVVPSV